MNELAPSQPFNQGSPLLRSGTISICLHIGFLGVILLFSSQNPVQPEKEIIHVTLVERPSLDQGPPKPVQAPPMLHAPRPTSRPTPRLQTSKPLTLPPTPLSAPAVSAPAPQPPRPSVVRTATPRLLQDSKAADTLTMQSLLKMASQPATQHTGPSPSTLAVPSPSTLTAIPQMIWTQDSATRHRNRATPSEKSHQPLRLSAANARHPAPGGAKVQLGKTIPPAYPRIAREQGWEGTVFLRASILPDGRPRNLRVRKSSGYEILDKAALEAVRFWRFIPARDGNIPITSSVDIPIHFDLKYTRRTGSS